jgi:DHA2 family multidrug resistance protein-like MFS transporter
MAVGIGMVATLATDLVLAGAPPERAGAASGLSESGAEFGGALGIAVLGTAGAAVYRAEVAPAVPPGLPAEVAEPVRETLAGAVVMAERLPELRESLLEAATAAFVSGLRVATVSAAAVLVCAAVLAGVLLRHVRPDPQTAGADRAASPAAVPE